MGKLQCLKENINRIRFRMECKRNLRKIDRAVKKIGDDSAGAVLRETNMDIHNYIQAKKYRLCKIRFLKNKWHRYPSQTLRQRRFSN